jgi:lipoprotein-anchoring transpeptidase ErfK/SrfK
VQRTQALYQKQTSSNKSARQATVKHQSATTTVNWHAPSEKQAYPVLANYPQVYFDVNIAAQRVYIRNAADHNHVLYTMYCATGKNNATPRGTYTIQAERGLHFYNASEQEGANYYVSWLNHGEYLFHTVPVNQNGDYIVNIANQIGQRPVSHGCVQLTIPDAKWVYENVPYGMKVIIH